MSDEPTTIRAPAGLFGGPDAGAVLAAALADIGRILTRQTRYGSLPIADAWTLALAEDAAWVPGDSAEEAQVHRPLKLGNNAEVTHAYVTTPGPNGSLTTGSTCSINGRSRIIPEISSRGSTIARFRIGETIAAMGYALAGDFHEIVDERGHMASIAVRRLAAVDSTQAPRAVNELVDERDEARDLAREMLAEIDETPERVGTYIKRDEPAHKAGEPIMRYFLRIDPETYERWQGIADSW